MSTWVFLKKFVRSIEFRIACLMIAGTLAVAATLTWKAHDQVSKLVFDHLSHAHAELSYTAASSLGQPVKLGFSGSIQKRIDQFLERSGDAYIASWVVDKTGRELVVSGQAPETLDLSGEITQVLETGEAIEMGNGLIRIAPVFSKKGDVLGAFASIWSSDPAFATVQASEAENIMIGVVVLGGVLACMLFILSRSIGRHMLTLGRALNRLQHNEFEKPVPLADRPDQFGELSSALEILRKNLIAAENERLDKEKAAEEQDRAVSALCTALSHLHECDLTVRIETELSEDYEALRQDFNSAVSKIDAAFTELVAHSGEFHAKVTDVAETMHALTESGKSNSVNLRQGASMIELLTNSVRSTAEHTKTADAGAVSARQKAEESTPCMQRATETMDELEKRSNEIVQVLELIDDIAFQTSLLALNAGVEAARAGPAGKGFAVVATEVRSLAQSAAAAAQESRGLIAASEESVQNGVVHVREAGDRLSDVVGTVDTVSDQIRQISQESDQQANRIEDVNSSISQLDQSTRDSLTQMETADQAVTTLQDRVAQMTRLLQVFTLSSTPEEPHAQMIGSEENQQNRAA